jgi:UDP-N-acetylglucosamine 2-epimerase (non-hydrolysing)
VVAGDVNSTLACAIVSAKANVAIAHLEAGLRSFDHTMPEQINRIFTDRLTDLHLTPSPDADENVVREGVSVESIARVGNVMVDSIFANLSRAQRRRPRAARRRTRLHALLTLHRRANVDDPVVFEGLLDAIAQLAQRLP